MKNKAHECIDGRCPVGIDSVKKIGLTPQEKRAIFFCLKKEMKLARPSSEGGKSPQVSTETNKRPA